MDDLIVRLMDGVRRDTGDKVVIEISKDDFREIILNLGAAIHYEKESQENESAKNALVDHLSKGYDAFKNGETESQGLRQAKKIMGWKFKEPVKKESLFWEYVKLIVGDYDLETKTEMPAISKTEAIEKIRQKYEFASYDAAYKQVQRAIKTQKNLCKEEYDTEKGYKGLLPWNWPKI
mgnify:CR=1 FL=1